MDFTTWHKKTVQKMSTATLQSVIAGKTLTILAVGSLFSIELIPFGYFILLASFVLSFGYFTTAYIKHVQNKKQRYAQFYTGWFALFLLALFVGVQSPQIPFKVPLIILGILLTLPGAYSLLKLLK